MSDASIEFQLTIQPFNQEHGVYDGVADIHSNIDNDGFICDCIVIYTGDDEEVVLRNRNPQSPSYVEQRGGRFEHEFKLFNTIASLIESKYSDVIAEKLELEDDGYDGGRFDFITSRGC